MIAEDELSRAMRKNRLPYFPLRKSPDEKRSAFRARISKAVSRRVDEKASEKPSFPVRSFLPAVDFRAFAIALPKFLTPPCEKGRIA